MNRRESTRYRIAQEHGNAIGSLYREQDFWRLTNQSVAILVITQYPRLWFRLILAFHHPDISSVHLPAARERPLTIEQFQKAPAIFINVFRVVFVEAGKVERVLRHRAHAAEPRRKRICKPVVFQCFTNQCTHAVTFAPVKARALECSVIPLNIFRVCDRFNWHRHH